MDPLRQLITASWCIAIGLRDHLPPMREGCTRESGLGGDNLANARDDVPYALAGETRLQLVALGDEVFIRDSALRISRELRL